MTNTAQTSALRIALALLLAGAASGALAQAYKIVGPDGKVTFTDKPPTASATQVPTAGAMNGGDLPGGLPYATRQAMAKYPVTLVSMKNCPGCDSARQQLRQRGVPFSEYSVSTEADNAALQARFGGTALPVVQIGNQTFKGYSSSDLASYLDAAGYPAQAHLTGYAWPAVMPLAPRSASAAPAPASSVFDTPPAASPSGIQF